VGALLAIMAIVPWTFFKPNADGTFASPFIMVFRFAGLDWASELVFFVVLTATASALNSQLYSAGRHLYQLAQNSNARILRPAARVSKNAVPANAIIFSALLIVLSPVINAIPGISGMFVLFASASSAVIIFIYILTMVAHYRYRRSEDFIPDGFLLRGYKVWDVVAIVFFVFVYCTLFISSDTLWPGIVGLIWLVVFGVASQRIEARQERADGGVKTGI
jgi:AAT family amino acid transporter